jgi:hypothetical protein
MNRRFGITALLAIVAQACGVGAETAWQGTITDSAGVAIVENPALGMWTPEQAWTVTEALRIGTAEGEPEYQFGALTGLAVAGDGRIVVLDGQGRHLKVFAPHGKYERTIGGPGGGPGEIGAAGAQIVMAPGDTLVVSDFGNQRVSLYLVDGTFVRSFPQNFADGMAFRWEVADDGRIVAQLRRFAFPGSTAPPDTMDAIVVRRLDGSTGDTLMRVPSGKTVSFSGGAPEWNLFVPEPLWGLWGDRILYGVSDKYRIGVYGPGAKLERVIAKPFTLPPVTDVDQTTIKKAFEKIFRAQGVPPQLAAQLMNNVHFASHYPAFGQGGMVAGPDGSIFVQLVRPISMMSEQEREALDLQSGGGGSPDWDVFDRDGRYLGVVTMPPRFQPARFIGDRIYGIQRDELDVQYVVVLNLVKGGREAGEG